MVFQIEWTNEALEDVGRISEYLIANWPYEISVRFEEILYAHLELLLTQPEIGIQSPIKNKIRSVLLTPHNRLYYCITGYKIIILNIFDTRQNPSKNKY